MDPTRKARFDGLHTKLVAALKTQGMLPKTLDSYIRERYPARSSCFSFCSMSCPKGSGERGTAAFSTPTPAKHCAW